MVLRYVAFITRLWLDSHFKVNVSPAVTGGELVERLIWDFEGKSIRLPRESFHYPAENVVEWHVREVFKGA